MTASPRMRWLVLSSQLLIQCLPPASSVATLCVNDITTNGQSWVGIDFLYPPTTSAIHGYVALLPDSPHIHHVDFNCCPFRAGAEGVVPILTEGESVNVSLPADPADRRGNCYDHYESVVWTFPQEDPRLSLPSGTVLAVGPGTICEYGYLEVHVREATTTGPGRACVEVPLRPLLPPSSADATTGGGGDDEDEDGSVSPSTAAAEEEPSDLAEGDATTNEEERPSPPRFYAQVVYFYASAFVIPSSASFWRVSTTRRYGQQSNRLMRRGHTRTNHGHTRMNTKAQTRAVPPFEVFAFKMHTHWRGISMSIYRVRGEGTDDDRMLIGTGDPSATQNWQYTNAANDTTPSESRIWVEKGDQLELECIYDARETNRTINNCNGEQCEMCWVYLQVRTEELVPRRLMEMMQGHRVVSGAYHDPSLENELEEEVDEEEGSN